MLGSQVYKWKCSCQELEMLKNNFVDNHFRIKCDYLRIHEYIFFTIWATLHMEMNPLYLKHTIHLGLLFFKIRSFYLTIFTNVDWANNHGEHSSTSSYIIFLDNNHIFQCSKKQKTITHSFTELYTMPLPLVLQRFYGLIIF